MNYSEVKKHVFFQIFYIIFIIAVIVFTIIYLLTDNVSAKQETSDVTGSIYTDYNGDCTGGQAGYCALQTNSIAYKRNINTSYSGVLNSLSFELHYVMNSSYQYTLNINAMSTDFRNNYLSVYACGYNSNNYNSCTSNPLNVSLRFVSKSQLQVIFPTQTYETYRVVIIGSPMSGINTYGIKSFILNYDNNQQDYSGIIDSQNQNTTDLINNNNNNTQDIILQVQDLIANNEELQQKLLEAQSCPVGPMPFGTDYMEGNGYINSSGQIVTGGNSYYSRLFKVTPNSEFKFNFPSTTSNYYVCFYTQAMASPKCINEISSNANTVITNGNRPYMRFTIRNNLDFMTITGPICNDWEKEAQDEMNNYLKDDSNPTVDSSGINSAINSVSQTNPLNYFLTLPTTLLNAAITGLSSNSCTAWRIGHFGTIGRHDLSNYDFTFPCIDIKNKIGNDLYNIIDVFVSIGIIVLTIVRLYNTVSNYLTLGAEEEVKSHSAFLSPMDFLANILGGNIGGVVGTARGDFD